MDDDVNKLNTYSGSAMIERFRATLLRRRRHVWPGREAGEALSPSRVYKEKTLKIVYMESMRARWSINNTFVGLLSVSCKFDMFNKTPSCDGSRGEMIA